MLVLGVMLGGAFGADRPDPTEAIKSSTHAVIEILENEDLKAPDRAGERRDLLREAIGARFDYREMAKRSLGKHWRTLNDQQRDEFVELFTALLAGVYAEKIEGYSGEQIEYLNHRIKGDYAEVKTTIFSGKQEIGLDYRLIYRSDDWKVYDVVVDGVSLVRNYRGQFSKIIRSSSYEELLKKLRQKVAQGSAT